MSDKVGNWNVGFLMTRLKYYSFQIRGSKGKALHDKVLVNCQYSMATFSTGERKRRPRGDRKSKEMTMHLQQTFDATIMTSLYPRSQIDIFVEVLITFTCRRSDKVCI